MKARAEEKEIVKRALAMLHGGQTLEQPSQTECPNIRTADPKPQPVTPETLAAAVLVENTPDEVSRILTAWREFFGIRLDRAKVTNQLNAQRQWQDQWRDYRSRGNSEE